MIRWVVFDDDTAEAVVSRFRRGAAEIHRGQALDAALRLGRPSLLLLPSDNPGRLLLARLKPKDSDSDIAPTAAPLPPPGVLERPTFTPRRPAQSEPARKKWWRRRSA